MPYIAKKAVTPIINFYQESCIIIKQFYVPQLTKTMGAFYMQRDSSFAVQLSKTGTVNSMF